MVPKPDITEEAMRNAAQEMTNYQAVGPDEAMANLVKVFRKRHKKDELSGSRHTARQENS